MAASSPSSVLNLLFRSCDFPGELFAAVLAHGGSGRRTLRRRRFVVWIPRGFSFTTAFQPFFKGAQAGRIRGRSAILDVQQMRGDLLRQIAIVGDEQNRARIVRQRGFKRFSRRNIQVVCRFVQSQNRRSLRK